MAIELIDTVIPKNSQPFPIVLSNDIRGGIHYVKSINEMSTISNSRRQPGMLCYVDSVGFYQLKEDLYTWESLGNLKEVTTQSFSSLDEINNPVVGQIVFIHSSNEKGLYFYDGIEWQNFKTVDYNYSASNLEELNNVTASAGSFCYVEEDSGIYYLSVGQGWVKLATTNDLNEKANKVHMHSYSDLVDAPEIPSIEGLATETYVESKIADMVGSAPETLDTLNKLSEALGNDENFSTTIIGMIGEKADVEHSHEEYVTDEQLEAELTAEMIFETDMTTVSALGGIKAGEDLNGLTVKQVLSKLLFPYVAPTCSAKLTYSPSGTVFEKGQVITVTSMTGTVVEKSENILQVSFLDGSTVLNTRTDVDNGGTFTYTLEQPILIVSNIANTRFRVSVTDAANKTYYANTTAINFYYPYYYGVVNDGVTLTGDVITSLQKQVTAKANKTYKYTTNNQRMVIAYPKSYGQLKTIKDQNNFDVAATFTLHEMLVTGLDGIPQTYYVYMNNASTLENFSITYSY